MTEGRRKPATTGRKSQSKSEGDLPEVTGLAMLLRSGIESCMFSGGCTLKVSGSTRYGQVSGIVISRSKPTGAFTYTTAWVGLAPRQGQLKLLLTTCYKSSGN